MYYKDFSKYENTHLPIYNIGWLDSMQGYSKGDTEKTFLNNLSLLYKREKVNQTRGTYPCYFCPNPEDDILLENNKRLLLGSAEIWVPSEDLTRTYAAPNLIIHYIKIHSYLPPEEFISAVNNFDFSSQWSGQRVYQNYQNGHYE